MTIRNCDGLPRELPVHHPKLPLAVATTECPMLLLQDPAVIAALRLHRHVQAYGVLPTAGGLDDQAHRDIEALDCIMASLAQHHVREEN